MKNWQDKMKKIILLLLSVAALTVQAEIRIYKGWSTNSGDCIATYESGRIYKGWSTNSSNCIATYESGRIYKGWSTNSSNCIATYSNKRLYKGWSTNSSNCILTFSSEFELSPALISWLVYHYFRIYF